MHVDRQPGRAGGTFAGYQGCAEQQGLVRMAQEVTPGDRQRPADKVVWREIGEQIGGVGARRRVQRMVVVRIVVGLGHQGARRTGSVEQEKIPNRYVWGADSRGRSGDLRREGRRQNGSDCAAGNLGAHGAVWKQEGGWAKETLLTFSVWLR